MPLADYNPIDAPMMDENGMPIGGAASAIATRKMQTYVPAFLNTAASVPATMLAPDTSRCLVCLATFPKQAYLKASWVL